MNIHSPCPPLDPSWRRAPLVSVAGTALLLATLGCSDNAATDTDGAGGAEGAAPTDEAPPDYASAFPQDRVARLDIVVSQDDWNAMLADMTEMLGEFGTGSGLGGGLGAMDGMMAPPEELLAACVGKEANAACEATLMGSVLSGTCTDQAGTLACIPTGGMGMPGAGAGAGAGIGAGIPVNGAPAGGGGLDLLPRTPIYVPCRVVTDDGTWEHVGIRFKGNSSLATPWSSGVSKLPLRLKFDEFEDTHPETKNQRYHGFKAIGLSNGALDQSLLRDKLGHDVFAEAGIASPATAFYRVYIDHGEGARYFGLYTGIEIPSDHAFMDTHFGGHAGNLYKPDGAAATWATWDPAGLGKENHEDEADYTDAKAVFDALHADRSDAAAWRAGLEATFDVDGFLHWLALNTVIQDWDSYGRMSHNYYLYADPNAGNRLHWIPWDHSFAFSGTGGIGGTALSLGLEEVTEEWPLIRFLLDDVEYQTTYRAYVARAAEAEYTSDWSQRFTAAHELIAPYVVGSEGERPGYTFVESEDVFEQSLDELVAHPKQRQADVAAYLSK